MFSECIYKDSLSYPLPTLLSNIKQSWQIICSHFSALSVDLNYIYLGISHLNDKLRKILSGFPDSYVVIHTKVKILFSTKS